MRAVAPSCTIGHTQTPGGNVMLCGTFSWTSLVPVVVVKQIVKAEGNVNITANKLNFYMLSVFPNGDGVFHQDNSPYHSAQIVLEWFQKHNAEFQLRSWIPNTTALTTIEHILCVMHWQLRDKKQPYRYILDLLYRYLKIGCNLSSNIWQILAVSIQRRVAAVMRVKRGPTRY